jgi:hypothetical protein
MVNARRNVEQAIGPEDRTNVKLSGKIFKLTHCLTSLKEYITEQRVCYTESRGGSVLLFQVT